MPTLRQLKLRLAAATLSEKLGKALIPIEPGRRIEGMYRRPIKLASGKFALIEKAREFTLVPWRDVLERWRGQQVSGIVRGSSISWSFQRKRGLALNEFVVDRVSGLVPDRAVQATVIMLHQLRCPVP